MSDEANTAIPAPETPSSFRLILTLGLISMISGLFIVLAFQLTFARIEKNKQVALEKAVSTVLPGVESRGYYLLEESGLTLLPPEQSARSNVIAGYDAEGKLTGLAMEGSARGYQDAVVVLYGYSLEKECIIGMTILQSNETPGLGDKAQTDPEFLANFEALDARLLADRSAVANPIETVKHGKKANPWQIDGISGATVTSTAVGNALRESTDRLLPLLAKYRDALALTLEPGA